MESRNITLTLEKAKEWYNSGNEALREAALQAYTEDELKTVHFSEIKSFEDACQALNLDVRNTIHDLSRVDFSRHLIAIYRLGIIRKALNGNWNPSLVKDATYCPYVRFYPAGEEAREAVRSNGWKVRQTFIADGKKYSLVGGDYSYCCGVGLGDLCYGYGSVVPALGLLGCKSLEIAKHMSIYFAKEIFEACYAHHVGTYEWV